MKYHSSCIELRFFIGGGIIAMPPFSFLLLRGNTMGIGFCVIMYLCQIKMS